MSLLKKIFFSFLLPCTYFQFFLCLLPVQPKQLKLLSFRQYHWLRAIKVMPKIKKKKNTFFKDNQFVSNSIKMVDFFKHVLSFYHSSPNFLILKVGTYLKLTMHYTNFLRYQSMR